MIERRGHARSAARRRANFVIFLGPAIVLTVLFFVVPVLIDIAVSFTDLSRSLRITRFTTEQYAKIFRGDRRLPQVIGLTFIYVFGTLAIFNVTFGLVLALTTTSLSKMSGGFFRGVWLLPRMSPSVLYILLWLWAISPSEVGLLNQVLMQVLRPRCAARSADAGADRADHHLQRLHRRIDGHDHLHRRDPRHPRAPVPRRRGRRRRHAGARSASSRCRRCAGRSAS